VKEGKTRRRAASLIGVLGGVLITAAAIALYIPGLGLFGLREIAVTGNRRVSAEAIARAADLRAGQPLMAISLSRVSSNVSSIPWILSATAHRDFPHGLSIRVRERRPVAWVRSPEDGTCYTVGEGGRIVVEGCESEDALLELVGAPFIDYVPGTGVGDRGVSGLVDALADPALSILNIRRIDVTDPSSVELVTESGLRVLMGSVDTHAQCVAKLAALSREVELSAYRQIDLRLEGEATLVTW